MKAEILISGFGGQGLMSLGKILAKAAVLEGKHTVFFPSYGAEMRGGTAHCFVKISDSDIASPFIEFPDAAIIFNQLSLTKFKDRIKDKTLLILNSDLIFEDSDRVSGEIVSLPLNRMALDCGDLKTANIIALGVLRNKRPGLIGRPAIVSVLEGSFKNKTSLENNLKGFKLGENYKQYQAKI